MDEFVKKTFVPALSFVNLSRAAELRREFGCCFMEALNQSIVCVRLLRILLGDGLFGGLHQTGKLPGEDPPDIVIR